MILKGEEPPEISVLMSVFNGSRWIKDAIDSILAQTFRNFELIIVDDGSTDQTQDIVRESRIEDSRIVLIAKKNTGLADSLNYGICQAKGKWIARLDADDISEPDRLAKQYQASLENRQLVLIGSRASFIDENDKYRPAIFLPVEDAGLRNNLVLLKDFFAHSSAFYRTDVVRGLGGYRVRIKRAEDYDLWLRLSETGLMACLEKSLIRYRIHKDQVSKEEGGRRQKIDARISLTSYWLRQMRVRDPVLGSDEEFEAFSGWIIEKLDFEGYFDYLEFLGKLEERKKTPLSSLRDFQLIGRTRLSYRKHFCTYLIKRVLGEQLPYRLAIEWSQISKKS